MSKLRTAYEKSRVIGPLHTGGPTGITSDGSHIATCVGEEVLITRLSDGSEVNRLVTDAEVVHSLCFTPSSSHAIVFTASLALYIYADPLIPSPKKSLQPSSKVAKAHDAPVHVCKTDATSTLLASGSADGIVKVWDIRRGYVTHIFRGHGGVVSALCFRRAQDTYASVTAEPMLQLITASVDTRLRVFDLSTNASRVAASKPLAVLEGHVSVPRGLDVTQDGRWLISGGRDAVALLWDFGADGSSADPESKKKREKTVCSPSLARTIPVLERIEATGWLSSSEEQLHFFTAGEKGFVKVWDAQHGSLAYTMDNESPEKREILAAYYVAKTDSILTVDSDQIIILRAISNKAIMQQLIGFNDEIVAASFLSPISVDSHLAVATNSPLIRVYSVSGHDARLLGGHSGIVLCLQSSSDGRALASGSKDNTARLWTYAESSAHWSCVAVCEGHAESVGAVALAHTLCKTEAGSEVPRFMFTGSQDRTIKMWNTSTLVAKQESSALHLKSLTTHKGHEKDINALDISPDDHLLASGSQDRTAKIFEIVYHSEGTSGPRGDIKLLGTCRGHKRGVWTVKFARSERVLATGSGDNSIKLWDLNNFSCIKTFEGHTNSVLQVEFLTQDSQLLSTASDGLLKSWNVKTEECIATMDNHEDKVWALAVSSDESTIITGAADSVITFWTDCTFEKERERQADRESAILREQDLLNYITMKDFQNALVLALSLDQPGRLLSLLKSVMIASPVPDGDVKEGKSITTQASIDIALRKLSPPELVKLLKHVRDWNANAKTSATAQLLLNSLLKLRTVDEIADAFNQELRPDTGSPTNTASDTGLALIDLVQALLPYTERHLARLDRLVQDTYIIDYVLKEMGGGQTEEMDVDF